MKLILVAFFLTISSLTFATCNTDAAKHLVENGMMESAVNDCGSDGEGLNKFSAALEHFQSFYVESDCQGKFAPRDQAYLECSALSEASTCVSESTVSLNCEDLLAAKAKAKTTSTNKPNCHYYERGVCVPGR
ncbi:MAG: hypothetical protein HOE90_03750 [Bacteriovoracaceae bacterium]|jgi:hypothetical protein|nr:hypothetical protein [Bacteriovoracaceae bacterium]